MLANLCLMRTFNLRLDPTRISFLLNEPDPTCTFCRMGFYVRSVNTSSQCPPVAPPSTPTVLSIQFLRDDNNDQENSNTNINNCGLHHWLEMIYETSWLAMREFEAQVQITDL